MAEGNVAVTSSIVLTLGSRGAEVTDLQHLLLARGGAHTVDMGPIDGIFGPRTQAEVKRFQDHEETRKDGVVDQKTWAALAGAREWPHQIPGQFMRRGHQGESVRRLQRGLKAHSLYGGAIDGDFGPMTHRAVVELQVRRAESNERGVVGPMTFMTATR